MTHDYKATLAEVYTWSPNEPTRKHIETIIHALKLAQKVTREPTEEMLEAHSSVFA